MSLALAWPAVAANAAPDDYSKRTVVQPGAGVYDPYLDTYCTLGFLLKDPQGAVYGVTAGTCAPDGRVRDGAGTYHPYVGSRTWTPGTGPVVQRYEPKHRQFGRYVAQVLTNNAYTLNYAIIRLDPKIAYDGTVAVVRGPGRHPYTGTTTQPTQVTFVCVDGYAAIYAGQKPVYDDGVRQDVAPQGVDSPSFRLSESTNGTCAGAPVLGFDGAALGIHSGYLAGLGTAGLSHGNASGPPAYRLDAIIAAAGRQLHTSLRLVQSAETGTTRR
jgi:hypothetical protein